MSVHKAQYHNKVVHQLMGVTFNQWAGGGLRLVQEDLRESPRYSKVRFHPLLFGVTRADCVIQELGINFSHIRSKSMTVLNPLQRVDERIMDDADLAGPLLFIICFGTFLLFVGSSLLSKVDSALTSIGCSQGNPNSGISTESAFLVQPLYIHF